MLTPAKALIRCSLLMLSVSLLLLACSDDEPSSLQPAQTVAPSPATTPAAAVPAPPSNVSISGALPNLSTPVPSGQGELGRITVAWQDNSANETGFRIYQSCAGVESPLLDVPANTTSHGPLQLCRPGRVGVAAFNAAGTSPIAFAP